MIPRFPILDLVSAPFVRGLSIKTFNLNSQGNRSPSPDEFIFPFFRAKAFSQVKVFPSIVHDSIVVRRK